MSAVMLWLVGCFGDSVSLVRLCFAGLHVLFGFLPMWVLFLPYRLLLRCGLSFDWLRDPCVLAVLSAGHVHVACFPGACLL